MGWFTRSSSSSSRPGYARSHAGSSYSSRTHHSSTSHYKRRPRDGYIQYLMYKLKQLWHTITSYARRHPYKVFFMVIMPLISGGVLHKLAKKFGVSLPDMGTGHGKKSGGAGGYYGSSGYEEGAGGGGFGLGSVQNLATGIGGLASVAKMAQAFI